MMSDGQLDHPHVCQKSMPYDPIWPLAGPGPYTSYRVGDNLKSSLEVCRTLGNAEHSEETLILFWRQLIRR